MNKENKEFFERVKMLRRRQGLSSEEFCKKIDINKNTYKNMPSNNHLPAFDLVIRMAKTLKVSLNFLAYGIDDPAHGASPRIQHLIRNIQMLNEDKFSAIEQTVQLWLDLDIKKNMEEIS
jgi:transcriptional regulator with XRE-family HTH domain